MEFHERLKLLRTEHNLSLRDVAKACGVSKSSIDMYEKGKRRPKRESLEAIADLFNVDIAYLMGWEEQEKPNSPDEADLTEGERMLLELFRRIPEEKQQMALQMLRAALEK